jgi:DNA-binding beta-propeller fold protein YncE
MKNQAVKVLSALLMSSAIFFVSCKKDKNDSPARASNLYFTVYDDNTVNKIDLGKAPSSITGLFSGTDGITTPEGITLTKDGYLIVSEESTSRILKMKKDGTGDVITLYENTDGVDTPTAIAVDNSNGNIYWCNSGTGQVFKGSADGLDMPTPLYNGQIVLSYAYGLAVDKKNNKLYICDFDQYIKVGSLDGTGSPVILWDNDKYNQMIAPSNIFLDTDKGKIYWCDENADQVVEANMDGTGTPVVLFDIADGVDRPDGVFVDKGTKRIYWTETNANVIARGSLDGSGDREVLISNVKPYSIVME